MVRLKHLRRDQQQRHASVPRRGRLHADHTQAFERLELLENFRGASESSRSEYDDLLAVFGGGSGVHPGGFLNVLQALAAERDRVAPGRNLFDHLSIRMRFDPALRAALRS